MNVFTLKFKAILILHFFTFILLFSSLCSAHGLTMSTANVTIRNKTHLMIRLQYDPLLLLHQIKSSQHNMSRQALEKYRLLNSEIPPLPAFTTMPDKQFELYYELIKNLLRNALVISYSKQAVSSIKFRFPSLSNFRKLMREKFMHQVIQSQSKTAQHDHDERQFYQIVEIDGFLPANITEGVLDIHFPRELGTVFVSLSQPVSQVLKPGKKLTHYQQKIKINQ